MEIDTYISNDTMWIYFYIYINVHLDIAGESCNVLFGSEQANGIFEFIFRFDQTD